MEFPIDQFVTINGGRKNEFTPSVKGITVEQQKKIIKLIRDDISAFDDERNGFRTKIENVFANMEPIRGKEIDPNQNLIGVKRVNNENKIFLNNSEKILEKNNSFSLSNYSFYEKYDFDKSYEEMSEIYYKNYFIVARREIFDLQRCLNKNDTDGIKNVFNLLQNILRNINKSKKIFQNQRNDLFIKISNSIHSSVLDDFIDFLVQKRSLVLANLLINMHYELSVNNRLQVLKYIALNRNLSFEEVTPFIEETKNIFLKYNKIRELKDFIEGIRDYKYINKDTLEITMSILNSKKIERIK